jgi:hypothetical protein
MNARNTGEISVNGRSYQKPTAPTVVICYDGCDPRYISHGVLAGLFPNISRIMSEGFFAIADAAIPTFTNPNNMSIVAGAPPRVHGISGNYYLDKATGREVMITDASLVSSGTVLAALADAGVRVAAITAKDKLRKMLGSGLRGICFSSERAHEATLEENGIDEVERLVGRSTPDMYSPDLSLFVLDAGIRLLETHRADVLYLSLSDMVQRPAAHHRGGFEFQSEPAVIPERWRRATLTSRNGGKARRSRGKLSRFARMPVGPLRVLRANISEIWRDAHLLTCRPSDKFVRLASGSDHSGRPAFRRPSSYLARSSGRRRGATSLSFEMRAVGSSCLSRATAICA